MTLATRCPWCETVFRLSKEQAALRAGMVRCGICGHTFNALDYLVRGTDLGGHAERLLAVSSIAKRSLPPEPIAPPEPAAAWRTTAPAAPILPDDDSIDVVPIAGERRYEEDELEDEPIGGERRAQPAFLRQARDEEPEPMSTLAVTGWTLLNLIALVALLGQAAYFWRGDVYGAFPQLSALVDQACTQLGCQIEPPGDIEQITVESSALEPSANRPDVVTFSTLLRNHSAVAQRYPAIELTLTDAQDHPTVRRVLLPRDYLSTGEQTRLEAGLSANSEVSIKLPLLVSNALVVGYRTRVFYP